MLDKLFTIVMSLASVVLGAVLTQISANKNEKKLLLREKQRICRENLGDTYELIIEYTSKFMNFAPKDLLANLDYIGEEDLSIEEVKSTLSILFRKAAREGEAGIAKSKLIESKLKILKTMQGSFDKYYFPLYNIYLEDKKFAIYASDDVKSSLKNFLNLIIDGYEIGCTGFECKNNKMGKDINLFDDARDRLIHAMKVDLGMVN